jgi:hypothetical protein
MSTMTNSAPTKRGTSKGVGAVILVLAALTALAPLANGMYIPGLPEGARSFAATRLAARVRINTLLVVGLIMGLAAMAVLVTLLVTIGDSLPITWVDLFVAVTGIGIVFPATMTVVQSLGHDAPGAASGLIGGGQFVFGAAASPLVGLFATATAIPMTVLILTASPSPFWPSSPLHALGRDTANPPPRAIELIPPDLQRAPTPGRRAARPPRR